MNVPTIQIYLPYRVRGDRPSVHAGFSCIKSSIRKYPAQVHDSGTISMSPGSYSWRSFGIGALFCSYGDGEDCLDCNVPTLVGRTLEGLKEELNEGGCEEVKRIFCVHVVCRNCHTRSMSWTYMRKLLVIRCGTGFVDELLISSSCSTRPMAYVYKGLVYYTD